MTQLKFQKPAGIFYSQLPQVMVKMLAQDGSDNHWLWERNKFINRKFMMQEMYQNYVEGDANWDVPQVCEPRHEKTSFLHMRKQRRRSASR